MDGESRERRESKVVEIGKKFLWILALRRSRPLRDLRAERFDPVAVDTGNRGGLAEADVAVAGRD